MSTGFGQLLGALVLERRESAGMGQRELAAESFPEGSFDQQNQRAETYENYLDGKERRIRELESGIITRPQARNYTPICETLNIDRAMIRALKQKAADAKAQADAEFHEVLEDKGSADAALADTAALTRDQLEALAARFEIEDVAAHSDTALREFLTKRAEDYRTYKAEIDAIDERTKGLGNLKAAARDAADNLDFEEVETLLSRVHEVEVEIASETAELRARNALLRGRVQQAYELLCVAADSFAAIDYRRVVEFKYKFMQQLFYYGLRYGGNGMTLAEKMIRSALAESETFDDRVQWAVCQNALALALRNRGIRAAGQEGADLLRQAVVAHHKALQVHTRIDHALAWAEGQNNLGNALQEQGIRTAGQEGADLLRQAVAAFRESFRVFSRTGHVVQWAATQNNLGIANHCKFIRAPTTQ